MKCQYCKKTFEANKYVKKRQKYCSTKCKSRAYYKKYYVHYKWKKVRKCELCGNNFVPDTVNQKYCKKPCNHKKAWKKRNWDKVLEKQREWFKKEREKNPEKFRWYNKDRRNRIRDTSGSSKRFNRNFTLNDWQEMKSNNGYKCKKCGKKEPEIKLTIDHIIPLSKKGKHEKKNIQPLCHSCNSRKKDKIE